MGQRDRVGVNVVYLIAIVGLFALLAVAVLTDIQANTIPNKLVLAGLALGLGCGALGGWSSLANALIGCFTGLILLLPAYAWAGMGAGDVKLMAAVGSILGGPFDTALAVVATLIAGAVLGIGLIVGRGGGAAMFKRYQLMFKTLLAAGRFAYVPPASGEAAREEMPYALAIAAGTIVSLWYTGGFGRLSLTG